MRLLVDGNILLYAVNEAGAEHAAARGVLERLRAATVPWCMTWGIVYEFLRVSTHPRVFPRPLSATAAWSVVARLLESDLLTVLLPTPRHAEVLRQTLDEMPHPAGNLFHDIHTAVLMREHGVPEIYTADTDFLQFRFLRVTDPVHGPAPA